MPQNFHRPDINYIAISRQNDQRYQLLTRNKKRPPTDFLLDLDFDYLIDVTNNLDLRIDGVSLGALPGVSDPTNQNKLLTTDGAGTSSWVFVQANNVIDASLTGSKLAPQTITSRELADGGIPTSKIQQGAIVTNLLADQCNTLSKQAPNSVDTINLVDGCNTLAKQAPNSVDTGNLVDGCITTLKIADTDVTLAKLNQDVLNYINNLIPIGTIIEFPGTSALPNNWLECNGQSVSRVTYASLFAVIGTIYGNVDGATFNLPDKRGRVAVGIGSDNSTGGRITAATSANISIGGAFGTETQTLDISQIPSHTHSTTFIGTPVVPGGTSATGGNSGAPLGNTSGSTGGGLPHPNVQPSMFSRYYIRAK